MRAFSQRAYNGLIAQVTNELFLALLTIEIDWVNSVGATIYEVHRVVAGVKNNVTSNGLVYTPYAFEITLPTDSADAIEQVQLTIDNVDQVLVNGLRRAVNPLRFKLDIVLQATPNVVELSLANMEALQVEFDANTIVATLNLTDVWDAKYPSKGGKYDPQQCPGLF